jgi:hypothetical protein
MRDCSDLPVRHPRSRGTTTWLAFIALVLGAMSTSSVPAQSAGSDVLARSIALYPTLKSYADTAIVVREAPGLVDRWKFKTYFRQPLDFYFDFQGVTSKSGPGPPMDASYHRMVLWMINGELQAFNQQLRTHETIRNQVAAMQGATVGTVGTSTLIPSLIFAKANLSGTLRQIQQATNAGFETVNGRRCHKIIGMAGEYYPSGQMTNVRQVTVWIDAETLLVRRVFEDTPKGYTLGSYSRLTVSIEPTANRALEDSKFRFTVPTFQQ